MKMKRIVALVCVIALAAAVLAGCGATTNNQQAAAPAEKKDSDLAYIKGKGNMVIGITLFSPMNYNDEKGELTGFETDFAKAVCEKLGVTPKFQEIDWDSKEVELNSKNIDCIWNGLTITEERQKNMSITNPYMENRQVIITKKENADKYKDNADGAAVVAEKGSTGEELIQADPMFKNAKYTALDSQAKGLVEVKAGTSDILVGDYTMATGSVGEGTDYTDLVFIDKNFENQNYGVAFRKGSDVTEEVNKIIKDLIADGTLVKIAEKYKLQDLLLK